MYDYQGFGKSQGRPSVECACEDALAAYDYLVNTEKFDNNCIIGVGQSFGSGVTGQLALHRKLAGVIMPLLDSPHWFRQEETRSFG